MRELNSFYARSGASIYERKKTLKRVFFDGVYFFGMVSMYRATLPGAASSSLMKSRARRA